MSDVTLEIDVLLKNQQAFEELQGKLRETIDLVTEGAKQFLALAAEGDRYGDVMGALATDITAANEALSGQVDKLTLGIAANKAAQAGLHLSSEEFRAIAVRAKEFADAQGMEFEPAMQHLVQVLVRGTDRMHAFGLESKGTADMLAELVGKEQETSVGIRGVTDGTDALKAAWTNLTGAIGSSIDGNGALTRALSTLAGIAHAIGNAGWATHALGEAFTTFTVGPLVQLIDKMHELSQATPGWLGLGHLPDGTPLRIRGDYDNPNEAMEGAHPMGVSPSRSPLPSAGASRSQIAALENQMFGGGGGFGPTRLSPAEQAAWEAEQRREARGGGGGRTRPRVDFDISVEETEPHSLGWTFADSAADQRKAEKDLHDRRVKWAEESARKDTEMTAIAVRNARDRAEALRNETNVRNQQMDMGASWATAMIDSTAAFAKAAGASESWLNLMRGTSEGVLAAMAWAKVAGGQLVFAPEAIAHTTAATLAFAAAANPTGGRGHSSGGGGGGGGNGSASATSGRFAGTSGGGSSGGRTTNITINMGPGLSSSRDVRKAVVDALLLEADNGHPLPYRVVQQQRH